MEDLTLPPKYTLETTSFINGWAKIILYILLKGVYLTIGSEKEEKRIKDIILDVTYTGRAIDEMLNGTIHPEFPFKRISEYSDEFTREYLAKYLKKSELKKFTYTYFERFAMYNASQENKKSFSEKYFYSFDNFKNIFSNEVSEKEVMDQLLILRKRIAERLKTGILSNQDQIITWDPLIDLKSREPPCLQSIWIRVYKNGDMEIHLRWRSRDAFTAYMVNLIGLVRMIYREIAAPNGCRIVRIIDYCDSAHINSGDLKAAEEVKEIDFKKIVINPQFMCRKGYANVYA